MSYSLEDIEKEVDARLFGETIDFTDLDMSEFEKLSPEKQKQIVNDRTSQYSTIQNIIARGRRFTGV